MATAPVGLTSDVAARRLSEAGPNALPETPPLALWRRVLRQFQSPLILLLLFALLFDTGLWIAEGRDGWPVEALAIGLILLLNAVLGVAQERRSEAAIARLKAMSAAQAWVLRDGRLVRVATAELVSGDVVRLEAGDRVPADGRLHDAYGVMLDEAVLTGESVPVDKRAGDEAFSGTVLVRGRALLEVVRTGASSAMGRLAAMLGGITVSPTPLERRVDQLGHTIAIWVGAAAVVVGVAGVAVEGWAQAPEMVIFAIALAVAAVPEGLPAVLTVALALGVERMAKHRAVVRRLSAVEALGSVTVIATDKTGTLTENRMDVRALDTSDDAEALRAIVLASDADLDTGAGDPLDLGLLRHAAARGVDVAALRASAPVVASRPFDSDVKFARVTVRTAGHTVSYLKGAPEVMLDRSVLTADAREAWSRKSHAHASEGLRVIGLATAEEEHEQDLQFLGLALLWDPPRAEVKDAVHRAQQAGLRVVMITGDHPATAASVAQSIGVAGGRVLTGDDLDRLPDGERDAIVEVDVFARVRPEQKLRLVEALQASGHIVAMTGDGVNDAPALKRSDVGIAMGQRGSDVSREVADLVLLDDNFATIVQAVEEGRGIYANIQTFLRFLFSTNLSEVLLVAGGAITAFVLGLHDASGALLLPLTAAQILWINLVTDGVPALALAFDRTPGVMQEPPRPPESPLLDRPSTRFVLGAGTLKALLALTLLGALPRFGYDLTETRAATFHFMAIGQLFLTYPSRHTRVRPLANPWLHGAVALGVFVQVGLAGVPLAAHLLGDVSLPPTLWAVVFASAALSWAMAEGVSRVVWRSARA